MCANFKPISIAQLSALGLPEIPFEYAEEAYPNSSVPLLFKSEQGLEWRSVNFGLIPKWAEDRSIAQKTYNCRNETLLENQVLVKLLISVNLARLLCQNFMNPNI